MSHSHTPGPLKQTNKKHKSTTGRSKRNTKQRQGGKIEKTKKIQEAIKNAKIKSKLDRHNSVIQSRKTKRDGQLLTKRLGATVGYPRNIVVIPLSDAADTERIIQSLLTESSQHHRKGDSSAIRVTFSMHKGQCNFLQVKDRDLSNTLNVSLVADIVLFVCREGMVQGEVIDESGYELLSALKAYGIPTICFTLQTDSDKSTDHNNSNKIWLQKYIQKEFDRDLKLYEDSCIAGSIGNQISSLCRSLLTMSIRPLHWRSNRSYLVSDDVLFKEDNGTQKWHVNISGYLRGRPLPLNSLVHVVGCGTYPIVSVQRASIACNEIEQKEYAIYDESSVLYADRSKQESLSIEAIADSIIGEQTWPTDDEVANADRNQGKRKLPEGMKLPNGMSSYQADWLLDEEGQWHEDELENNSNPDDNPEESVDDCDDNISDHGIPETYASKSTQYMTNGDDDVMSIGTKSMEGTVIPSLKKSIKAMDKNDIKKLESEDREYPDELDTPTDRPARDRFARYRALQSFRSSPWHPKENLPQDYNRIYQFENFIGTQKRVIDEGVYAEKRLIENEVKLYKSQKHHQKMSRKGSGSHSASNAMSIDISNDDDYGIDDMIPDSSKGSISMNSSITVFGLDDMIKPGQYVNITVEVDNHQAIELIQKSYHRNGNILQLFNLLKHENKLSVLHFTIQRTDNYQEPIKAKEELIFQVGFRRYSARPVYSEANLNCDKHRSERFLRHGKFSVATVFGPISYMPCSVMVYKKLESGEEILVATGSLLSVNPDRIILKRVILTGYPIRVRKKFAVVKHMFYNPEDVLWYKPAELITKQGLRGHITETVGTHGLFKSLFSGSINQSDTVMLVLYKRVYPKFPAEGLVVT